MTLQTHFQDAYIAIQCLNISESPVNLEGVWNLICNIFQGGGFISCPSVYAVPSASFLQDTYTVSFGDD